MNKLQRITIGLALLATLVCGGGVSASAKSGGRQRALSGVVLSVNLRARTIEVRDKSSDRVVSVRVPEGALLQTTGTAEPFVQIERLLPGMSVRGIAVR